MKPASKKNVPSDGLVIMSFKRRKTHYVPITLALYLSFVNTLERFFGGEFGKVPGAVFAPALAGWCSVTLFVASVEHIKSGAGSAMAVGVPAVTLEESGGDAGMCTCLG